MSAYIVSDETITAIAEALRKFNISVRDKNGSSHNPRTEFDKVGQILLDQNYASVNARYNEDTKAPKFEAKYIWEPYGNEVLDAVGKKRHKYTLAEMYGSIRCYAYQSCETRDWDTAELNYSLQWAKDCITEALIEERGESMPWGIDRYEEE